MKHVISALPVILLSAGTAIAQPPATTTTQPAGQKVGLATSLHRGYGGLKNNLTAAADKLNDADYEFKPSSMAEVRGYGKLFAHVA